MIYKLFFCLIIVASCSYKKNQMDNQTSKGHSELYSEPNAPKDSDHKTLKRIVIAATNDLQAHYGTQTLEFNDSQNPGIQNIGIGGIDIISSYFKILREQFGEILLFDSGDIFSSHASETKNVSEFYSNLDYNAVTLGLNDFNIKLPSKFKTGPEFLKDFTSSSKTPVVLSNLYDLKTARPVEWKGTAPYLLKEVNGVKIGILGIIPDDMVEQTPVDNRLGLYVEDMITATLRQARMLRSLGAEIIVVITHQGLTCGEEIAQKLKLPLSKVNFDPEQKDVCDLNNLTGRFLNRLPPGLVDLVIGGRTDQKTANVINTTLVMSNFPEAKSFSYAEFFVDTQTGKLNKKKTIIHQPVMFCREFFHETNDCYSEDKSIDHKRRKSAKFLGSEIKLDPALGKRELKRTNTQFIENIQTILDLHGGDISYSTGQNGDSKLILMSLTGLEMSKLLESEFNQGAAQNWRPGPFRMEGENLNLSLLGSEIDKNKHYKILANIHDLQNHPLLRSFIARAENQSLNHFSWNGPANQDDNVSTIMAASEAVR